MSKVKVKGYSSKELLDRARQTEGFNGFPKEYWLMGVRSKEDTPNTYDDKFYLFKGEEFVLVTSGTTNPGTTALINGWKSVNKKGAFILKSDYWHYGIWRGGKHKQKMKALVQIGTATGYRDNNNNDKSEEIGELLKEKWIGINFHYNDYNAVQKLVKWLIGGWSYGCQVANVKKDYDKIIEACYSQKQVDYVLLKEF